MQGKQHVKKVFQGSNTEASHYSSPQYYQYSYCKFRKQEQCVKVTWHVYMSIELNGNWLVTCNTPTVIKRLTSLLSLFFTKSQLYLKAGLLLYFKVPISFRNICKTIKVTSAMILEMAILFEKSHPDMWITLPFYVLSKWDLHQSIQLANAHFIY